MYLPEKDSYSSDFYDEATEATVRGENRFLEDTNFLSGSNPTPRHIMCALPGRESLAAVELFQKENVTVPLY